MTPGLLIASVQPLPEGHVMALCRKGADVAVLFDEDACTALGVRETLRLLAQLFEEHNTGPDDPDKRRRLLHLVA